MEVEENNEKETNDGHLVEAHEKEEDNRTPVILKNDPPANCKLCTTGYVGIDTLQEQIRKKVVKKGFEFNIIVVGRSGLGKSTLVNTLFRSNVCRKKETKCIKETRTTQIESVSHTIEEKGVTLRLTVTDTPGFGDLIDNTDCWIPILEYINEQYERYLGEEQRINRQKHIPDSRVHCCLYFIEPTGHTLKPIDVEFMRRLDKCVNIVPVIAKADTLTLEERVAFKKRIKEALVTNGIRVYPMQLEEDADDAVTNNKLRELIPFAVVGSDKVHAANGRSVLGRKTQWGLVEVENRSHCEFADLRDMLIRTHMQDLVEVTSLFHYENFRHDKLQSHRLNGQHLDIASMNESNI